MRGRSALSLTPRGPAMAEGYQLRIGYGGEGDEEHPIVELLQEIRAGLEGKAGLARPPGPVRVSSRTSSYELAPQPPQPRAPCPREGWAGGAGCCGGLQASSGVGTRRAGRARAGRPSRA